VLVASLFRILGRLSLLVKRLGEVDVPKVLENRVQSIMSGNPNMRKDLAYAIATKQLQKEGKLKKKR
jgi:hypothetical protein